MFFKVAANFLCQLLILRVSLMIYQISKPMLLPMVFIAPRPGLMVIKLFSKLVAPLIYTKSILFCLRLKTAHMGKRAGELGALIQVSGATTLLGNYAFPANGLIFLEDHIWVEGQIDGASHYCGG